MKNSVFNRSACLLSISEVVWLLGVPNSRVCRDIRVGTLPVVRRGRRLLVPASALVDLTDSGDTGTDQHRSVNRGDAR